MGLVHRKGFYVASMLVAASLTGMASASTLDRYDSDTRVNGMSAPDAFSNVPAGDTDGSLKYSTNGNAGSKVAVTFYRPNGGNFATAAPLGTLGSINALSFDYYMDGSSIAPGSTLAPAVRLKLSPLGTPSATYVDLVWERIYNVAAGNEATPLNAWQNDVPVIGQKFWERSGGVNHDGNSDFQPLPVWSGGYLATYNGPGVVLSPSTPIYGVEISLGSGLPANFAAYIDDVNIGFSGGDSFSANVSVPEPTTIGLISLGAIGLLARRRTRVAK